MRIEIDVTESDESVRVQISRTTNDNTTQRERNVAQAMIDAANAVVCIAEAIRIPKEA